MWLLTEVLFTTIPHRQKKAVLVISGRPTRRFCFEAFLPTDKKERRAVLEELKTETRTSIIYEAPHRLVKTLQELLNELGD